MKMQRQDLGTLVGRAHQTSCGFAGILDSDFCLPGGYSVASQTVGQILFRRAVLSRSQAFTTRNDGA